MNKLFSEVLFKHCDKNPVHHSSHKSPIFRNIQSSNNDSATNQTQASQLKKNKIINSNKPKQGELSILWSTPFSAITLNRLKLITRTKLNDLILSLISTVLREYLQSKGINNPQDVHCLIPVDLTSNKYPMKMANRTTISSLRLPTNTEGIVPGLWMTRGRTNRAKNSGNFFFGYLFMLLAFKSFPNRFAAYLTRCLVNKNTLLATSLGTGDASLSTVTLCSQNVREILFVHPTVCRVGISFSIINYGESMRLAVMSDPELFSNPEFIVKEFNKKVSGYDVLKDPYLKYR